MVAEVYAGLSAFKAMFDMAKGLKDINDAAIRNGAVIELQEQILSAQSAQSALVERVGALEKEMADFETWNAEKERYELKDLGWGAFAHMLKPNARGAEPPHWVCTHCYGDRRVEVIQYTTSNPQTGEGRGYFCPNCGYYPFDKPGLDIVGSLSVQRGRAMVAISENPVFQDADKAREFLESQLWPHGSICPHCGVIGGATHLQGKAHRSGVYKCNACGKQFTVTVGTLFERSHIPLNKWLLILHLMVASKKGISAHQIHRMLGLTYKSAWFACHRLREAMREGKLPGGLGGEGKFVEADETYVGGKAANRAYGAIPYKEIVVSLVERGGHVRSHHVADVTAATLKPILVDAIAKDTHFRTDSSPVYTGLGVEYASHETVNHSIKEYVRGDAYTNTAEGYFSILKRGIYGVYHHVSAEHLKRYLGEFDFRYNYRIALGVGDDERMAKALSGIVGKRLTYRRTRRAENERATPF